MKETDKIQPEDSFWSRFSTSRREFIKISALGAVVAAGGPAMARQLAPFHSAGAKGRDNSLAGRIVIGHDPEMEGHLPTINRDRVEEMVHRSVAMLTQHSEASEAFESLFPGVTTSSAIAIKVNCIGTTSSRWEVVRGIVSGLSLMLDGTYDVGNVTIFDSNNLYDQGYDEAEFTFNGHTALLRNGISPGLGYYPVPGHALSRFLIEADYVINVPVLKTHNLSSHEITGALKNHYGSCYPQNLCNNIPGMLTLNADQHIGPKTCLVITDALRGTFNGDPMEPPQAWTLYPEQTPNTLLVTTDPVTNEYWARDMINEQRVEAGYSPKVCPWIEGASEPPYELGVSNPELMTVLTSETSVESGLGVSATYLGHNTPNPFSHSTTLHFRLARGGQASLQIVDLRGRIVRHLVTQSFPEGYSSLSWDGRDHGGRKVPAGVYFARLQMGTQVRSRRVVFTR